MLFDRKMAGLKSAFRSKNKLSESDITSPKDVSPSVELDAKLLKSPSVDTQSKTATLIEEPKDAKGSWLSNVK